MVDVDFEIKFCRAEMILKESLRKETTQRKISRVEMMDRALQESIMDMSFYALLAIVLLITYQIMYNRWK